MVSSMQHLVCFCLGAFLVVCALLGKLSAWLTQHEQAAGHLSTTTFNTIYRYNSAIKMVCESIPGYICL